MAIKIQLAKLDMHSFNLKSLESGWLNVLNNASIIAIRKTVSKEKNMI